MRVDLSMSEVGGGGIRRMLGHWLITDHRNRKIASLQEMDGAAALCTACCGQGDAEVADVVATTNPVLSELPVGHPRRLAEPQCAPSPKT